MRAWIVWCARTTFAVLVVASCGTDRREPASGPTDSPSTPTAVSRSDAARARVSALRRRFHVTPAAWPDLTEHEPLPTPAPRPVIGEAAATSFEATAAGSLRAVLPHEAKRAVLRAASVELPLRADAMARVEDDATHVSIGFALRDASAAPIAVADGIAIYAGALAGSDVVHRVHAEGTEDFVVFEAKPAREELVYEVEVSRVAGLRLVNGTLEFLDEGGAPRLRVAPPYVVDESGTQSAATIAVLGCAHDTDPSAPWGRPVTRAGASRCEVRVAWHGTGYPLLVDPSWTVTGSMTTARYRHTATLLASGKVLIVGGNIGGVITNGAEFFDGSSSFAATGWMTTPRENHTATLLPSGKVLIAGGNTDAALPLSSAALFDGIGSFVNTGSMTAPRLEHTATLLPSGKVLIAGGRNKVAFEASAELFDGGASFAPTGAMATGRYGHRATLLASGKVLVTGGRGVSGDLSSAEVFDGNGSFTPTSSMGAVRKYHTSTLLSSGKVLVTGWGASAELFDGSGSFAPTGSMGATRSNHTATLLPSGKVLVVGGYALTELFDGHTSFGEAGSMSAGRAYHTATLLPSGQTLVAGGYITSSAELFGVPAGAPCAAALDCGSDICNDGICCVGPCGGLCTTCAAGTGACTSVKDAVDADSCGPSTYALVGAYHGGSPDVNAIDFQSGFVTESAVADGSKGKSALRFIATTDGTPGNPNKYAYWRFSTASRVLEAGDHVEYDVYLESAIPGTGGLDIQNTDGTYWRGEAGWADQNGVGAHPATDLTSYATGQWYHRILAVPAGVLGKTIASWDVVDEDDAVSRTASVYYANVAITNGVHGVKSNRCDPNGVCKLASGQPASDPATCANGLASDGFCCDTACGAACDVCAKSLGALTDGTCSAAAVAYAGDPACGNGFACDGVSVICPATCVSDIDCLAGDYCAANGACRVQKAQGDACSGAAGADCLEGGCRECATGHCVDGVCCDTACDALCQACSAALKESALGDGVCDSVKAQTNPHGDNCPDQGAAACGANGLCSGAGACSLYYPAGTSCGAGVCLPGNKAGGDICSGSGKCSADPVGVSCENYLCDQGSCPSTCVADAQCVATASCQQGKCVTRAVDGAPCTGANQCMSNLCVDGYCCNGACAGQCAACDAPGTEGTCTLVVGAPHGGRPTCGVADASAPCSATTCDGVTSTTCGGFVGSKTSCRAGSCASGVETLPASCDGKGECPVVITKPCAPYACGEAVCKTTCGADADCASGSSCDESTGACVAGATCGKDGHTATRVDGTSVDCAPFNCDGTGACRTTCGTVDDCASPSVCDGARRCVAPGASGDESAGCAVSARPLGGSAPRLPALLVAIGLAALGVRRRRARPGAFPPDGRRSGEAATNRDRSPAGPRRPRR